jgi:hypothetical protein
MTAVNATGGSCPRGFHGRWVGTHDGKVLRVFHGDASLGDVKQLGSVSDFALSRPNVADRERRTHLMIGIGKVVGSASKTISTQDIAQVVDNAVGTPTMIGPYSLVILTSQ